MNFLKDLITKFDAASFPIIVEKLIFAPVDAKCIAMIAAPPTKFSSSKILTLIVGDLCIPPITLDFEYLSTIVSPKIDIFKFENFLIIFFKSKIFKLSDFNKVNNFSYLILGFIDFIKAEDEKITSPW